MDTHQLRQFISVARCQSMTAAAKELGVSQPSLSQAIKKLENSLGVSLFSRVGRTLELNEYGEVLLAHAETAFRSMENAKKEMRDSAQLGRRSVRLIARCPMGNVAYILERFHQDNPDIMVSCLTPSERSFESDYDIELFASERTLSAKNILPICSEDYLVCVTSSHKLASHGSVALRDLTREKFIVSPAESAMNATISSMFEEVGFSPRVSAFVAVYSDILQFVEHGLGICIAAETSWLIGSSLNIAPLRLTDVHRQRTLYLKWPPRAYLSTASLALIDSLCETIRSYSDRNRLKHRASSY